MLLETRIYRRRYKDNLNLRNQYWKILVEKFFQQFVLPNDIVLDAPCGFGFFINNIKAKIKYGLDLNPESGEHLDKDVKFICGQVFDIKLKAKSVDKIFAGNIFEHLTHSEIVRTVDEYHRVLKDDGQVLVLQPNIRFAGRNYWMFFDHITSIDDRALDEIFEISGFELSKKYLKFLPHITNMIWPFGELLLKLYLELPFIWHFVGVNSFIIYSKKKFSNNLT